MKADRRVVLDASAVVEWLLARRDKELIDRLLAFSVIPASALTEAIYVTLNAGHALAAEELRDATVVMGVAIEPITEDDAVRAGELIATSRGSTGGLSMGDGLCIAVAERLRLPITGGDRYWETLDLRTSYLPFR